LERLTPRRLRQRHPLRQHLRQDAYANAIIYANTDANAGANGDADTNAKVDADANADVNANCLRQPIANAPYPSDALPYAQFLRLKLIISLSFSLLIVNTPRPSSR
jgi:hypothetical protein